MPKSMSKKGQMSLRDLENENKRFLSPSSEKERDIMEAAVSLIGERGVDGATTAEIARRAGVTERTLFRYFPSKKDLIKRTMFPMLLRVGMMEFWERLERLFKQKSPSLKEWLVAVATERLQYSYANAEFGRTVLMELLQNEELKDAMGKLFLKLMWNPMIQNLEELRDGGQIRKDIDIETLARAIHCVQIGYFITRFMLAPNQKWKDEIEIEKMADLLTNGSSRYSREDALIQMSRGV